MTRRRPKQRKERRQDKRPRIDVDDRIVGMTKVVIGTTSDELLLALQLAKQEPKPRTVGRDDNGLIVEWDAGGMIYGLKRSEKDGINCYRIAYIQAVKS
jgi:hypothetical protein